MMASSLESRESQSKQTYLTSDETTASRTIMSRPSHERSKGRRPATALTSNIDDQDIVCAISESRGISPTVGLAFVNLSTCEAVLCQICDGQTYTRTCHKLKVFNPSEILFMKTAADTKLLSVIRENLEVDRYAIVMQSIDRRYWSEASGHEYVRQLAFLEDLESLKVSTGGSYFAMCSFAATLKYLELAMDTSFCMQSLRIRFEPSEGSMHIDLSTIVSLELIQNLQHAKSKDCLYGILNETLTPMGSRLLRSNILQPSTYSAELNNRYDALDELALKEEMFFGVRQAMKHLVDADRVLASVGHSRRALAYVDVVELVIMKKDSNIQQAEQSINHVVMLKTFVDSIKPIWQALTGATSEKLKKIRQLCDPTNYQEVYDLLTTTLNEDVRYSAQPLEMRNQRTYAIKAGVNGFLDVARQSYKEASEDAFDLVAALGEEYEISLDIKYDPARQFFIAIPMSELRERKLPDAFINVFRCKGKVECQTIELVKLNQRISDAHHEVVMLSDKSIQDLTDDVRTEVQPLFKISEGIAILDMIASFAQLVTTQDYVRPELTDTLAVKAGRHPMRERIQREKYIANDVYATQQNRLQIVTGCNMSGKSTYIRSIALMAVVAQIGCFVPAQYASFPMTHQLFARISTDDSLEANVSTFASEMCEMAFIIRNIERRSVVIVDELGRGTSTADGMAVAIAIVEALLESRAYVWFVTHFRDLPRILQERSGVVNLHLAVQIAPDQSKMKMLYKVSDGYEQEKFYGITLARVAGLPDDVVHLAAELSDSLHERNEARRGSKAFLPIARRRKLILSSREQLIQARNGLLVGPALRHWLIRLQTELIVRLGAIDAEAGRATNEAEDTTSSQSDVPDEAPGSIPSRCTGGEGLLHV